MKNTTTDNIQDKNNNEIKAGNLPITAAGVEEFLASRWVEGIGAAYARRLTDRFGADAVKVLTEEPERAEEISGLGASRIATARESILSIKWNLNLMLFLFSCGVGDTFIDRIFRKYRNRTEDVVLNDPYAMVEQVWQLSFYTADKIGKALGIPADDPRRLFAALVTAVKQYAEDGHLYATPEQAEERAAKISGVSVEKIKEALPIAVNTGRIVDDMGGLYLPVFHTAEKEAAEKIAQLASVALKPVNEDQIPAKSELGHTYSPMQRDAIRTGLQSPVMAITGGPGSGKTTVVKGIIDMLECDGKKVVLAAPTGRAAKRLSTLTGAHATTIHSLLGYRQGEGYYTKKIDADLLIIDEGSMMEQVLFNHLLQAVGEGTRIILVGDVDQLPAIGAGDVLRDIIASGVIPVARLEENFRQSEGSLIASGARAINSGAVPNSDPERDFIIILESTPKKIHDRILSLVADEMPAARGINATEIQVVTPQQIGTLGARQLNIDLQERLNPDGPALRRGGTIMRLGDPVMQTANSRERGVYNGEIGRITYVSTEEQKLDVTFSDGWKSTYARSELSELTLAYATTVHKLQGSEAKHIIIPVTMAHKPMLYRNLLYTGVSRATDLCILVGEKEALEYAVSHTPSTTRNSNFRNRLRLSIAH